MTDSVRDRLVAVFVTALDLPDGVDVEQLKKRDHPTWDSLGHLALVVGIEEEFDVELDSEQLIGMDSFGAALDILSGFGIAD